MAGAGRPGPAPSPRLPFEPIAELFVGYESEHTTYAKWGFRTYGITHSEFQNARQEGLTIRRAERWCDLLGTHPFLVWGDDYCRAAGIDIAAVAA